MKVKLIIYENKKIDDALLVLEKEIHLEHIQINDREVYCTIYEPFDFVSMKLFKTGLVKKIEIDNKGQK
jgi:hypothetical protein